MAGKPVGTWLQHFWCSCVSPPAVWGDDGYYPPCFSFIFISIAAVIWYQLGESSNFEGLLLFFLPHKHAKAIRQQLAACRAILAVHGQSHAATREIAPAAYSESPHVPCPICGAAGETAVEASTLKTPAKARTATAAECTAVTQARTTITTARNRCIGGYHAILSTTLALACVLFDERLRRDKANGTSLLFTITGITTGGYFFWDLYVIIMGWGPGSVQWLVHAVISVSSVCTPFLFPSNTPMSYYAASLLLFEASTPFYSLRYFVLKTGASQERAGKVVHLLFVVSFFLARLVYGCLHLFPELWEALHSDPYISNLPLARRALYHFWMPIFGLLQFFWFLQMLFLPKGNRITKKQ